SSRPCSSQCTRRCCHVSRRDPVEAGMRLFTRIVLALTAAVGTYVGIWAAAFPRSFYDSFPGFGFMWISVDGPYNEHLIRDVGALYLAIAAIAVVAFFS